MTPAIRWLLFLGAIGVIAWLVRTGAARGRRNTLWRELARRLRGRFRPGLWLQPTSVEFQVEQTPVRVSVLRGGALGVAWRTVCEMPWPANADELRLRPRGAPTLGAAGALDDEFRRRFEVSWAAGALPDHLLSPGLKFALLQAARATPYRLSAAWSAGTFTVELAGELTDARQLHQFIELARSIFEQAALVGQNSMEFTPPAERLTTGNCRVCGEPLLVNLVACRACRTLHHRECWQYNQKCCTYGCGETVCLEVPRGENPA